MHLTPHVHPPAEGGAAWNWIVGHDLNSSMKGSGMEILAVLRSSDSEGRKFFVMQETTCLNVDGMKRNEHKFIFAVPKCKAPCKCRECGADILKETDIDDEPASILYACGKLVLRDYCEAVYIDCTSMS